MADDKLIKELEAKVAKLEKEVEILRATDKASSVADLASMNEEKAKLLQMEIKLANARGDGMQKIELARELMKQMSQEEMDAFQQGAANQDELAKKYGMTADQIQELVDLHEELGPVGVEAYEMMRGGAEDVAVKMGLVSKKADGILNNILKIGELAKSPKGIQGMAMALMDTLKPTRIFASLMLKIAESTIAAILAADKASAAFAKQTGMGRVATQSIQEFATAHANLGVTIQSSGIAHQALTENVAGFLNVQGQARTDMLLTTAMFDRLGVGAETGAMMIEDFSKRLNMTGQEAANMTRDMALTAKGLGMSMKKFVSAFNSANKSLAVYGKKGVKVFNNVAAAARAAGVETEALLGLAGKFDTFSDAADTTGKLNAILGTQMSAMDLLTMKEDERIEYLLKNMQVTGKSFAQMNKFEQMAVANAAGITDMAQANKIFGMSFRDYKKHQRDMAAQEKSQEEANKRMQEAMDITEQLKTIMQEFVIDGIGPYIDDIKDAAVVLSDFIKEVMSGKAPLIAFSAGLVGIAFILSPLVKVFGVFGFILKPIGAYLAAILGKMVAKIPVLSKLNLLQSQQNTLQNTSKRISVVQAKAMSLLGKSIMFMGIGIGIAAAGIALFAREFGKLSAGQMIGVSLAIVGLGIGFAVFVMTMLKLAPATAVAAAGMYALGGAVALIGLGVALVAVGLAILVDKIVLLAQEGMPAIGVLLGLAVAMYGIAAAAAVMGNPLSLIGLYILLELMEEMTLQAQAQATMATAVGGAISGMGDIAIKMKDAVTKFAELASADFFAVFAGLYFGINSFMKALDLDSKHGVQISHTLENLALIATGKSAGTINGTMGSAIVNAINRIGAKDKDKQTIKVTVDAEHLKQAMRDGYFELRGE